MICYGTRLLSALARREGVEPHLILFKRESSYKPIFGDKDRYQTYQYYYNGLLRGSHYAIDPISDKEVELLIQTLKQIGPDAICLSTRSFAYQFCKSIFPRIKNALPKTPIISGGWGPTLEPEKFLEFSDYVGFGEGEATIVEMCRALKNGGGLSNLPNLIYWKDGSLIKTEVLPTLKAKELNELPFPDFDVENKYLISDNRIKLGPEFYNEKVYDCFAARGCPLNCTYCMSSKYRALYLEQAGQSCPKYRLRDLDVVLEEVRQAKARGAKFIRFKDEVFPIHPKWIEEFLERYPIEIDLPFFGFVRPEFHSPETIKRLRDVGLCVTMVGIQSGSSNILEGVYHRQLSKEQILEFARTLADLKIQFNYHFIYRNPFETESDLEEMLDFLGLLPEAPAFIYKLEVFPGSPISRMIEEQKPQPIDRKLADWYALLHSMILKGPIYRRLARLIHRRRLFRSTPLALSALFIPPLIKELYMVLKNRYFFKASLHFAPKAK